MEIIPGIHRIDGVRGANAYLVVDEGGTIIIDTGMPGNAKRIAAYVQVLRKSPADVRFIILTHADLDHSGSAAELKRLTGARLAIHAGDAQILRGNERFKTFGGPVGLAARLAMRLIPFRPVEPDIVLSGDPEIHGFRIVHVPGHTNGSICVYKPSKVIFVGDALRCDSSGNPRPPSRISSLDHARAGASLAAISALDFDTLLPGHGAPLVGSASQRVRNMVAALR